MSTFVAPAPGIYRLGEECGEDADTRIVVGPNGNIYWAGGSAAWDKFNSERAGCWYVTPEGWTVTFKQSPPEPPAYSIAIIKPGPGNDVECEIEPV